MPWAAFAPDHVGTDLAVPSSMVNNLGQWEALPLAFALAISVASPASLAHAQEPAAAPASDPASASDKAEPVRAKIMLAPALGPQVRPEVEAALETQLEPFARAHGLVLVGEGGDEPELFVRLQPVQPDKEAEVYMIHSSAWLGDEVLYAEPRPCLNCTVDELVAELLKNVEWAAALAIERRAANSSEPEAEPNFDASAEPAAEPVPRSRSRLGAAGYGGISSTAIGLGGAIVGAVFLDRGAQRDNFDEYKVPAGSVLGAGLGLMAVGTVLLAVDLGVLAKRRSRGAAAGVDGVSVTMQHGVGVAVFGRF